MLVPLVTNVSRKEQVTYSKFFPKIHENAGPFGIASCENKISLGYLVAIFAPIGEILLANEPTRRKTEEGERHKRKGRRRDLMM